MKNKIVLVLLVTSLAGLFSGCTCVNIDAGNDAKVLIMNHGEASEPTKGILSPL